MNGNVSNRWFLRLAWGRPAKYERLEILNAILYLVRTGCAWRLCLMTSLPGGCLHYFSSWRRDGIWSQVHDTLRTRVRIAEGREAEPSAAILDSQSVKTTEKGGSMDMMPAKRSTAANGISS